MRLWTAHCRAHHGPRVFPVHLCSQAHVAAKTTRYLVCCNRFLGATWEAARLVPRARPSADRSRPQGAFFNATASSPGPDIPKRFFPGERMPMLLWSGHSSMALTCIRSMQGEIEAPACLRPYLPWILRPCYQLAGPQTLSVPHRLRIPIRKALQSPQGDETSRPWTLEGRSRTLSQLLLSWHLSSSYSPKGIAGISNRSNLLARPQRTRTAAVKPPTEQSRESKDLLVTYEA